MCKGHIIMSQSKKGGCAMRTTSKVSLIFLLMLAVGGCNNKEMEERLQKEISDLKQKNSELDQALVARDQFVDEVVASINGVYSDLETARAKEKRLLRQTQTTEKKQILSNQEVRQQVVQHLAEIRNSLRQNRRRIANLEAKVKASEKQFASLNEMVEGLKHNLEEREKAIANLESELKELAGEIDAKTRQIAERDAIIHDQQGQMNTMYYVVGTRKELEEKGIIQNEGGFPFGLLGATTILASGFDESNFKPLDRLNTTSVTVDGEIDEIVPKRNEMLYTTTVAEDQKSTTVTIVDPKKFWQARYLVIIKG